MAFLIDLIGQRYGRLAIVDRAPNTAAGLARWLCQCDCGATKIVTGDGLRSGSTKSCGCLQRETARISGAAKLTVHGHAGGTHGQPGVAPPTPTYISWQSMKQRCLNPNAPNYHKYGGRGIGVHPDWVGSFEVFLANMGERPNGTSLDRIDSTGHYEPGNCRWATPLEQRHNRRAS